MKHGSPWSYDKGCHCQPCTDAKAALARRRYIPSRRTLSCGHGPALDVDEVAVYRACRGDLSVPLNRTEMFEVFVYLDAHRYTARDIALRLGITQRTVQRWRAKRRDEQRNEAA